MISLNPNYLPRPHLQMPPTDQLGGWADKTQRIYSSHSSQLNKFYLIRSFKKLASKTSFKQLPLAIDNACTPWAYKQFLCNSLFLLNEKKGWRKNEDWIPNNNNNMPSLQTLHQKPLWQEFRKLKSLADFVTRCDPSHVHPHTVSGSGSGSLTFCCCYSVPILQLKWLRHND